MMRRTLAGAVAGGLVFAGAVALAGMPASGGSAVTLVVDTTDDSAPGDAAMAACTGAADDCSLRGAFEKTQADHAAEPVVIQVPAGTFVLDEQLELFNANVVVQGAGAGSTVVVAGSEEVLTRHLALLADGDVSVTLTDMTFTEGFEAEPGGSIAAVGEVSLTVQRMHFVDNGVRSSGGAIVVEGGRSDTATLVVEDSTFVGNAVTMGGGAIFVNEGSEASITNSTFTENHATFGGAMFVGGFDEETIGAATATLNHVTLAGNTANEGQGPPVGGALGAGDQGEITFTGTIIEKSVEAEELLVPAAVGDPIDNCVTLSGGTISSGGFNVVDDDTCNATEESDQEGTAANVGALGDNGGPTFTMALTANSPAVDAAGATCGVPDDQRGVSRPQDGNADGTNGCDSGAFELASTPPGQTPTPTPPPTSPPAAQPVTASPRFTG